MACISLNLDIYSYSSIEPITIKSLQLAFTLFVLFSRFPKGRIVFISLEPVFNFGNDGVLRNLLVIINCGSDVNDTVCSI